MKVLLVSDYAAPFGGAERMLFRFRDLLRARGHEARTFTSTAGGAADADYTCTGTLGRFRTLLQSANPHAAMRLRRAVREFQPDVVWVKMFLTQLSPLILPVLDEAPAVYHASWYRAVCPTGTKRLPNGQGCRERWGSACYRNACVPPRDWLPLAGQMTYWTRRCHAFSRIVANSEWTRRVLSEGGIETAGVIPNGVPVVPPRPALTGPPTAIFAGRLTADKGADVLLRAFATVAVPEARLVIAGDGPERTRLLELSRSLGLHDRIDWPGHLDGAALERLAAAAWIHVLPSLWAEPFGVATVEAAMRGTATIASNTGGSTEIVIDGRTGLLTPPGDVQRLAAALSHVLRDRRLAESIGAAARERALAEYTDDLFAERWLALFREILGG